MFCRPFSKLLFNWLNPFLAVGFSRPLEKDGLTPTPLLGIRTLMQTIICANSADLWHLPHARLTNTLTTAVEANFFGALPPSKQPPHLRKSRELTKAGLAGSSSVSSDHAMLKDPKNEKDVEKTDGSDSKDSSSREPELGYEDEKKTRSWFKRAPQDKLPETKKAVNPDKIDHSLIKALNTTFFWRWWLAGILKLIGGTSSFPKMFFLSL